MGENGWMSIGRRLDVDRRMVLGMLAVGAAAGCTSAPAGGPGTATSGTPSPTGPTVRFARPTQPVAIGGPPAMAAVQASKLYVTASPVAVLTTSAELARAAALGIRRHWPVLLLEPSGSGADSALRAELTRLGVTDVVALGQPSTPWTQVVGAGVTVLEVATDTPGEAPRATPAGAPSGTPDGAPSGLPEGVDDPRLGDLPAGTPPAGGAGYVLVADGSLPNAAAATAQAAGAKAYPTTTPDARTEPDVVSDLRKDPASPVVVIASTPAVADVGLRMALMAQRAPELPGGGHILFPDRRMVALYGHPGTPSLGVLGEQDAKASVERAKALAAQYAPLVSEPVIAAFEIIATVASASATPDGNYSNEVPIAQLKPYVDAAGSSGMYAVLDLQPGRTDFLTQAKLYEPLLALPHVGLALDPEWRLAPGGVHLRQIGSVDVAEINTVIAWLADLVNREQLPQKLLTLHQFQLRMIRHRERLDLSHPEVAVLVHADGQGSQGDKQATWHALQQGLPKGVWLGWKNFYDEDHPMLTPEQTIAQVHPTPFFISYQ